jgi:hypothetical protein
MPLIDIDIALVLSVVSCRVVSCRVRGNITHHPEVSVSVWTQTADVEDECDGWLNYDRTPKLSPQQTETLRQANLKLIGLPRKGSGQK